jgi:hypothetical protein
MADQGGRGRRGAQGAEGAEGAEGARGAKGGQGERGPRGSQSTVTRMQLLAIFLLITFAFSVVAVRTEVQQRQITANAAKLTQVVYTQCAIQDASNARQAQLIDSAIATERRKPKPDQKRIADLIKFRPDRIDCGSKP